MSLEEEAFKECYEPRRQPRRSAVGDGAPPDRDYSKPGSKFDMTLSRPVELLLRLTSLVVLTALLTLSALVLYPALGLIGAFLAALAIALLVGVAGRFGPRLVRKRRERMAGERAQAASDEQMQWRRLEAERRSSRPPRQERLAGPDPRKGPPLSEEELHGRLLAGGAHFDAQRFWEAHEAWEAGWHRAPAAERDFFQGLIHVAAALHHHQRGNVEGHDLQRGKAFRKLRKYGPAYRGVEVEDLLTAVVNLPPPGAGPAYPKLRLSRNETGA